MSYISYYNILIQFIKKLFRIKMKDRYGKKDCPVYSFTEKYDANNEPICLGIIHFNGRSI